MRKAQTLIELLITYSWAVLIILIFIAIIYYYKVFEPSRILPERCDFGSGASCTTFKFQQKNATTSVMSLLLIFSNGLGHDIAFESDKAIVTTEGVGKVGVWNYVGTCTPVRVVIKGGGQFACRFNINDTEAVPSFGKNVRFRIQIQYINCDTDPYYPFIGGCTRGSRKTIYGELFTLYKPYTYSQYCGDGYCNSSIGETITTCDMDCQSVMPVQTVSIISPLDNGYYYKFNTSLNFTINPPSNRILYVLDEERYVSVQGNTSIGGPLSFGRHNITVHVDWSSSPTVVFRYCLGDLNGDYWVDWTDWIAIWMFISNNGVCSCGQACWGAEAYSLDINDNCVVSYTDMSIIESRVFTNCITGEYIPDPFPPELPPYPPPPPPPP